jgi:hypothetical protein
MIIISTATEDLGGRKIIKVTAVPVASDIAAVKGLGEAAVAILACREYEILIIPRPRRFENFQDYNKKTRVYVSTPDEGLGMECPPYGSWRGDGSAEDLAWKAYNKLELAAMRTLIATFGPVFRRHTQAPETVKFSFSRKAGCSCPCSPGFVADTRVMSNGSIVDIHISEAAKPAAGISGTS